MRITKFSPSELDAIVASVIEIALLFVQKNSFTSRKPCSFLGEAIKYIYETKQTTELHEPLYARIVKKLKQTKKKRSEIIAYLSEQRQYIEDVKNIGKGYVKQKPKKRQVCICVSYDYISHIFIFKLYVYCNIYRSQRMKKMRDHAEKGKG